MRDVEHLPEDPEDEKASYGGDEMNLAFALGFMGLAACGLLVCVLALLNSDSDADLLAAHGATVQECADREALGVKLEALRETVEEVCR